MKTLEMRPLGNTGITVTRLSAGGHFTMGPSCHQDISRRIKEIHHMIDSGITYFDVQWEPEEIAMAEVMKTRRDEMTIAWPLHGVSAKGMNNELTADYILNYCHQHCQRFTIEQVDILLWIGLNLNNETEERTIDEIRKAIEKLKTDGFCKHFGFSCHYSPEIAHYVVEKYPDIADVMMVPYSPLHPASDEGLFSAAKSKGIGTIAMKPFGGAGGFHNKIWDGTYSSSAVSQWLNSPRPYEAAIRWVMKNDDIDCIVPGMHSIKQIDEIVLAVESPYNTEDEKVLVALAEALEQSDLEVQLHGSIVQSGKSKYTWGKWKSIF
jgi:aryl-alcohol dehydrogenase-like predicted oxidoreductase